MTDVEVVGGKNASLGEMISQLAATGVRVPGGFATTAHAYPRVPAPRRPRPAHPGQAGHAGRRRRARAGCRRRRDPPVDRRHAAAASARGRHPRAVRPARGRQPRGQLRRALVGHRRGPARRLVRRPAGDLPERHRHRRRAAPHQGGLRVALQRPRHQLPRAQGLRARRGRAVGRRAAHGALRPRLGRRDLHHRHRVRLQGRGLHHRPATAWARPWCRARSTPTSSTSTSRCWPRAVSRSSAACWAPSCSAWGSRAPRTAPPAAAWCRSPTRRPSSATATR